MAASFNRNESAFDTVHQVSEHLYTYLTHFLFNGTIPLNNRGVVVHLADAKELLIINPCELTAGVAEGLKALEKRTGAKVRHLLSPGDWHYMFIGSYLQAFSGSTAYVPPGRIPKKAPGYPFTLIDITKDKPLPQFAPHLEVLTFRGMLDFEDPSKSTPRHEFVFYHPESKAFTAADVFMYTGVGEPSKAMEAAGMRYGVLEFHFMKSKVILDSNDVAGSIGRILQFKPENYICQHGGLGNMIAGQVYKQLEDLRKWASELHVTPPKA